MYIVTRVISLVTSVLCLGIVIAGICTQPIMSLFFGNIPSSLAWILSFTASYYAYEVEQIPLGYFIGYALICVVCGLAGTPLPYIREFLYKLYNFVNPKPQEMLFQSAAPQLKSEKPKESWKKKVGKVLDAIQDSVLGGIFTLVFIVPIAILDTIIGNIFFNHETKEERQIWKRVFRNDPQFHDYKDVYGENFDDNYNKEELWIYINGIMTNLESAKGNCKKMRELFGQPGTILQMVLS